MRLPYQRLVFKSLMADSNSNLRAVAIGTCLFLMSFVVSGLKKPSVKFSTKPTSGNRDVVLVDLNLPYEKNSLLQYLKNEEIIRKALSGLHQKYYFFIKSSPITPAAFVMDYLSKLYSKLWNDAVELKCLGIDCVVLSDNFGSGIERKRLLQDPALCKIYTHVDNDIKEVNDLRAESGLTALEIINTTDVTLTLENNFNLQPSIQLLDACLYSQYSVMPSYTEVAIGGTFDRLHNGHRKLLSLAAAITSEILTIGVTGEVMLAQKSNASIIDPFVKRRDSVIQFLHQIKPSLSVKVEELSDPFGPTITDGAISAIIVSSETLRGAFKINEKRVEKGMRPLHILISSRTDSAILSSSFVRKNFE